MAVKPGDIQAPGSTARQRNRDVRKNNVGNRGSKIKDMGTAGSIRDLAREMKKDTALQVESANRTQERGERMAAKQIDSAREISRARINENDQIGAAASAKAEAAFKRRDNTLAAYTQIVADSVGIAAALQEKRKGFEQDISSQELAVERAKKWAELKPIIDSEYLDGTPEGVANANAYVEKAFADLEDAYFKDNPNADDPEFRANERAKATSYLVGAATHIGAQNHNTQVYQAGVRAENLYKEQRAFALETGDYESAIEALNELEGTLKNGLLTPKEADLTIKAAHAAVVEAALQHHYERDNLDKVDEIIQKAQGTHKGDDPTLNAVVGEMRAQGVPVLRAMAIIGAESNLDQTAKNPHGSASGIYQQINDTFRENYRKVYGYDPIRYFPKGVNKNVGMARNFSLAVQAKVGAYGLAQHQNALKTMLKRDYLTDSEAYSAHVLGPNNAHKLLTFPDSAPITSIVSAKTARINPWTKGNGQVFTVGEVKAWMHQKMETNKKEVIRKGYVQFDKGFSQHIDTDKVASWGKTLHTEREKKLNEAVKYAKKKAEVFSSHSGDKGEKADPVSFVMDRADVMAARTEVDSLLTDTDEQGNLRATPAQVQAAHKRLGDVLMQAQRGEYRAQMNAPMPHDWGRVLTEAEAASKANAFRDLDGKQAVDLIRREASRWGPEYWPVVARQLQKYTGSTDIQVALMFDPVRNPTLHDNFSRVINADVKEMEKNLPDGITLKGKYDGLMPLINEGLGDIRDTMIQPHYSAKTRGEGFEAVKNMAAKMAMHHLVVNPEASREKAAEVGISAFKDNIIAVNTNKARIAMTRDDLDRHGMTPDDLERGMEKVTSREFVEEFLADEVLGVGDPNLSRPLYEPQGLQETGSLDLGEFVLSGLDGGEIPKIDIVPGETGYAVVPKPGTYQEAKDAYAGGGDFYGTFATQYQAEAYARAMIVQADKMIGFDREQTIDAMVDFGQVVEAPGGAGVMIMVRTASGTGRSPVTGINGRPLIIDYQKLREAADL